jgi:hypothetical protein
MEGYISLDTEEVRSLIDNAVQSVIMTTSIELTERRKMKPMRKTLIVRRAMQEAGAGMVYTNLYERCHTVKCYSPQIDDLDYLNSLIQKGMSDAGYTHISWQLKELVRANGRFGKTRSIIVRIPRDL